MTETLNYEENVAIMNSILLGYEYMESLDLVKETKYYRQNIKQKVQSLSIVLEKTDALGELCGINDEALIEMMKGKERLMRKLAPLRPELKFGLDMVLTQYFEDPVLTLNKLGIDVDETY